MPSESAPLRPKTTYRPKSKLEVFFTGGAARLSPDGALAACASADEVKIVQVATGNVMRTLPGDTEPITALCFTKDGKYLFAASRSLILKKWEVATGLCVRSLKPHNAPIADLAIDSTGGLLATASSDRTVRVYDVDGGFCTHVFKGHSGVVLRVLFHPDPNRLQVISGGDDAEVRVWDLNERSCTFTLKSHFSAVTGLGVSPDGYTLLSGGRDKVVHAWDLRTGKLTSTVPVLEPLEALLVLPPGASFPGAPQQGQRKVPHFITAGDRGVLRVWRADSSRCLYEQPHPRGIRNLAAHSEGQPSAADLLTDLLLLSSDSADRPDELCVVTGDARLVFYRGEAGAFQQYRELIGNIDEVTDLRLLSLPSASGHSAAHPAHPTHVAVSSNGEDIKIFETETLSCVSTLRGHTEAVLALDAWRANDRSGEPSSSAPSCIVVSGSKDRTVRAWDPLTARCLGLGEGHIAAVSAVAISRKTGTFAVSAGADKLIKVWDLTSCREGAASSGDAASTKAPKLKVLGATAAHDKDINALAVAPNDSLCITASQDKTAKVWKLPELTNVLTLRGHRRGIWGVAFSPVDKVVATSSGDRTVKLWSLKDGSCLKTFEGHTASVLRVAFVSLGTQLLSSGADGLVKLWNIKAAECVNTFELHEDKVWALDTSGPATHESLVATGGGDSLLCLWQDATLALEEEEQAKRDQELLKEQELMNAMAAEDFLAAARIAFELRQPGRLLHVVNKILSGAKTARAEAQLQSLVASLTREEVRLALEYCREWNAKSRSCHAAQATLQAIVRTHSPKELGALSGVKEVLEGVEPYTRRHMTRMDRLLRQAYLLDYTLECMKVLTGEDGENGLGAASEGEDEDDAAENGAAQKPAGPTYYTLPNGQRIDISMLPPGFDPRSIKLVETARTHVGGDDMDDFELDAPDAEDEDAMEDAEDGEEGGDLEDDSDSGSGGESEETGDDSD